MYENIKWQENSKLKLLIIVGTRPEINPFVCRDRSAADTLIRFWPIPARTTITI